jgi:hypothetical protein
MSSLARAVASFPSARIDTGDGLPVEVTLIAQMGHGAGDQLFTGVLARQAAHGEYVDALDEPSTRLGGTDFARGDATSLYTFAVGAKGHPFHRHAGHRVFTAVSGSSGVRLRFSSATTAQMELDPASFLRGLHGVDIPPDCLFTVRFGGHTWHQFSPRDARHPAFFALSCHTNELGGDLSDELKRKVVANDADIPSLTELLPKDVIDLLDTGQQHVPTIALSLDAVPGSLLADACLIVRGLAGRVRGFWARLRRTEGFSSTGDQHVVTELATPPAYSLLFGQLEDRFHHEDTFRLELAHRQFADARASDLLGKVLEGFLQNPPTGVARMMALRNKLVKPLGLRTSPLSCPVSSLLSPQGHDLFAQRFPVIRQAIDAEDTVAQVILGADDKHLRFRTCVAVRRVGTDQVQVTLGTRVRCTNLFGHAYMAAIGRVHRGYVSPIVLRKAVEHAFD